MLGLRFSEVSQNMSSFRQLLFLLFYRGGQREKFKKTMDSLGRDFEFFPLVSPMKQAPLSSVHFQKCQTKKNVASKIICLVFKMVSTYFLDKFQIPTYSHLSNKREVTLTDFEKFPPPQNIFFLKLHTQNCLI